jgi:hypothetical protein
LSILSSHPLTEDRLKRMSEEDRPTAERPAATDGSGMGLAQGDLQLNPSAQAASNSG